jgi:hypothetical protein
MKTNFKFLIGCMVFSLALHAQSEITRFTPATELLLIGEIMPTTKKLERVDTTAYPMLPPAVKKLLTQSAGKAVCFRTNSLNISAKWCVTKSKPYPNLTAIANKGIDLYIKRNGQWQFAGVGKPDSVCNEALVVGNLDDGEKECLLYLPIYDQTNGLEIGVDQKAYIKPDTTPFHRRILVYGSSITQGASVSRPGMAYPARLSRLTGWEFLNLGLSGSAKMEPAVVAMLNDIQADAYVLDCIPNSSAEVIRERALNMVFSIQKAHPGKPIILLNTISREQGFLDNKIGNMVLAQNKAIDSIANELIRRKTKDFYFINTSEFLGNDHEGSTDGIHPNDLGSYRFVEKLKPLLVDILQKYFEF